MFEDADGQIKTILKLVEKCPVALQEKCFDILLTAYTTSLSRTPQSKSGQTPIHAPPPPILQLGHVSGEPSQIPPSLSSRFGTTAKRLGVLLANLERLFDFSTEPFGLHAYSISGKNNSEKTRNVALLVAAKTYLATGSWTADEKEVKAECANQNCFDAGNFWKYIKAGSESFKTLSPGKPLSLSASGTKSAEALLKLLAEQP